MTKSDDEFHHNLAVSMDILLNGSQKIEDRKNGFVILTFPFDELENGNDAHMARAPKTMSPVPQENPSPQSTQQPPINTASMTATRTNRVLSGWL